MEIHDEREERGNDDPDDRYRFDRDEVGKSVVSRRCSLSRPVPEPIEDREIQQCGKRVLLEH